MTNMSSCEACRQAAGESRPAPEIFTHGMAGQADPLQLARDWGPLQKPPGHCVTPSYQPPVPARMRILIPFYGEFAFEPPVPIAPGTQLLACIQTCPFPAPSLPLNGLRVTVYDAVSLAPLFGKVVWGNCP